GRAGQRRMNMKNSILSMAGAALAGALPGSPPQPPHPDPGGHTTPPPGPPNQRGDNPPPPVPAKIQPDEGSRLFLVGHAYGTQNYICLPSGAGFKYVLFTPEATLFEHRAKQVITHFFSPNPEENNTVRATWQHSRDTSIVWAKAVDSIDHTSNPELVAEGAIPWL